jgi:AcrR family transcriptional regulator
VPTQPKQDRGVATRLKLLDAAVDELIDRGYSRLTTSAVADRAQVSRGAQQRYFPHKNLLVAEAVRHLAHRQHAEIAAIAGAGPGGRARVQRALDVVFEQYSGPLFAAMIELSLAGRTDSELARIVAEEERSISRSLQDSAADLLGPAVVPRRGLSRRWAMALATARGVALLRLLGHPTEVVDRQWSFARSRLLRMLVDDED